MVASLQSREATSQFLTINQVATYLNISRRSVYALIEQGLPYVKVGCHKRFTMTSLNWWISRQERSTDPDIQALLERQSTTGKHSREESLEKPEPILKKRGRKKG